MELYVASLDLKQAFDRVTPKLQCDAVVGIATQLTLAMALLRELDIVSFQGITIDDVSFDRSVMQGGHERPTLFKVMMRYWVRLLSTLWKGRLQGHRTRTGTTDEDDTLPRADRCCWPRCRQARQTRCRP